MFKKDDKVEHAGNKGRVIKVTDKAVHVKWGNGFFTKFHFNPTHHMQTPISELKKDTLTAPAPDNRYYYARNRKNRCYMQKYLKTV